MQKLSMGSILAALLVCLCFGGIAITQNPDPATLRQEAQRLQKDGNFKEALDRYRRLLALPNEKGSEPAQDLNAAFLCMARLRLLSEVDDLLASSLKTNPNNWRLLQAASSKMWQMPHHGVVQGKTFIRNPNGNQTGIYVDRSNEDRQRSLQWLAKSIPLVEKEPSGLESAQFYMQLAQSILNSRSDRYAWRLQEKTDLLSEIDYADLETPQGFPTRYASVDATGKPVFHTVPESWEKAKSDGERFRWALSQTQEMDPKVGLDAKMVWGRFLNSQFSVDTLQENLWMLRGQTNANETQNQETGLFAIHTLSDEETIAKLAIGIKRLRLPDEFNSIKVFQELAKSDRKEIGETALAALTEIHLNRRQFVQAVQEIKESIRRFGENGDSKQQMLNNIIKPRGAFDPIPTQLAGKPATLSMVFRNGKSAEFKAHQVDLEKIIADTKNYYQTAVAGAPLSFGGKPNTAPPAFEFPSNLFDENELGKYATRQVATWKESLEPRENHWDRRIDIETPLKKPGLYVVTANFDGVEAARCLLWIQDTAILRKPLDQKYMYWIADAETGNSLAGVNIEFFGIQYTQQQTRGSKIFNTKSFSKKTDAQGRVILGSNDLANDHQWFAIARDGKGRLATLGTEWIGLRTMQPERFDQLKAYGMSDRPAYRPGDTIHAKLWLARSTYSPEIPSVPLASEKFTVRVIDPQGKAILEKPFSTDKFGGIEIEIPTTKKSMLGVYSAQVMRLDGNWIESPLRFRVEEYRKPEFEVKVVAPEKPVALGETIRATIRAKYYFGSPVTEATATIRVHRTPFVDNYYPVAPFDWCFGPGYWWHAYDYSWYPGWRNWVGCARPAPWWIGFQGGEPPELVLEQEIKLDASGEAKIEIDTATAKAFQADQDHRYSISVEVRDASRRTIDASGQVVAARQPFKIYSWLDRGFYRVGDKATASFHARTAGGESVSGKGKLDLFRIEYDEKRAPVEKRVQSWQVETKEDGRIDHVFQANASGQYRIRLRLTDAAGHEIEGAYVFTVRGDKDRGADFRFNEIELITDRQHYQPNDKVQLQINADREGALVLLFVRAQGGVYPDPQFIKLEGKSKGIEIPVTAGDQPNFFIEALTVFDGQVHTATCEVLVPPEKRILNVKAKASKEEYLPGEEASIDIDVTDAQGKPTAASTVIAVYDRSIEAIAGDLLPGDIREFFWKWRRNHYAESIDNLRWQTYEVGIRGAFPWVPLGLFGNTLADEADALQKDKSRPGKDKKSSIAIGRFGKPGGGGGSESMSMARGLGMGVGGMPAPAMAMDMAGAPGAPMVKGMMMEERAAGGLVGGGDPGAPPISAAPATIRKDFADTALWIGRIETDPSGHATKKFKMPENVTSWKIRTWAMGEKVRVGSDSVEAVTRKNLLVRLQAPRFLVERDQCVISSIVNNDLPQAVEVRVRLEVDGETQLQLAKEETIEKTIRIESHEQKRVDWKCIALAEGEVTLRTIASSSVESDAMQIKLPILVNGILKTDSFAGTVRPVSPNSIVSIKIPDARRIEQSRLTIRMSPSLAASMVDALPYMVEYPHGCTEQTLNRFLPTVITQRILLDLQVDLEKVAKRRNNLNAQELGLPAERSKQWKRFDRNPVFDKTEVNEMVDAGLRRLTEMQCSDGGWGWFSGTGEHSWPHTTAVVVRGLRVAQQNDVAIVPGVVERGIEWLAQYQSRQLQELKNADSKTMPYKMNPDNLDALVFQILIGAGRVNEEMQTILYEKRQSLSIYGMSLLALGTHQAGNAEQTKMLRQNIEQFLVEDGENETAFLRNASPWWYWYGSEIEGTAAYLQLLTKIDPMGRVAPRLVKHLLNNRKHATYWSNTRDTAYVIEAFADYIRASGETSGSVTGEVFLGNARLGSVAFTPDNLFDVDNTISIAGNALPAGEHRLEIRRSGQGPIYWSVYSTNFTLEEEIAPAGLEVKVNRRYYLMTPVKKDLSLAGDRGQVVEAERAGFERTELVDLTEVKSGSTVEVELTIESKNDYEYLLLEDNKPATLEPIEQQSGYSYHGGLRVYREFRDQRVSFFLRTLPQGTHSLRYRLRAEAPGTFTALPSIINGMYAPELIGSSADFDFRTTD